MVKQLLDNRYQLLRSLTSGGFGHTYLAQDLKRPGAPICVVKQLKPKDLSPELFKKAKELFNREADILGKLGEKHLQIPQLLAYFEENNEFYLVQEYIEGHTLDKELIPHQKLSEQQVINLISELLEVLQFIHSNGAIHRDIHPQNIIRRKKDNKLVLIDFGAVKEISAIGEQATAIYSVGYAPPEQCCGKPNVASDIYAVGIIGIQAVIGINPDPETTGGGFQVDKEGEIVWQNKARVSRQFARILTKMVRKDYRERYQSTTEVLADLRKINNSNLAITITSAPQKSSNSLLKKILISGFCLSLLIPVVIVIKPWESNLFNQKNKRILNSNSSSNSQVITDALTNNDVCEEEATEATFYCKKYVISGERGQEITIKMNSNDFDPVLVLHQPDGSELDMNDDISPNNWNAEIIVDLPIDGDYTIITRTNSDKQSGTYSLIINQR